MEVRITGTPCFFMSIPTITSKYIKIVNFKKENRDPENTT